MSDELNEYKDIKARLQRAEQAYAHAESELIKARRAMNAKHFAFFSSFSASHKSGAS